jgi:Na+/melibiose symporter-like transporter
MLVPKIWPLTWWSSFYKQLGFGNNSFMYTNISSATVVAVTIPCLLLYDRIGRRPIMIVGSFLMIPGLLIVAILGSKSTHSSSEVGAIVFSVILYSCAVKVAFSTPCYMVASEIGGVKMRKKSESRRVGLGRACFLGKGQRLMMITQS